MSKLLSPAQVAKLARCGRSSVMRALVNGDLRGVRDNKNRWKVSEEEAKNWADQRPDNSRSEADHRPDSDRLDSEHSPVTETASLTDTLDLLRKTEAAAAAHEARADALAAQVEDLRAERDRLLSIIEKQSEARTHGFFARLFGR